MPMIHMHCGVRVPKLLSYTQHMTCLAKNVVEVKTLQHYAMA